MMGGRGGLWRPSSTRSTRATALRPRSGTFAETTGLATSTQSLFGDGWRDDQRVNVLNRSLCGASASKSTISMPESECTLVAQSGDQAVGKSDVKNKQSLNVAHIMFTLVPLLHK